MMNSLRTIRSVEVDVYLLPVELNERQSARLLAIMKHFGTNITALTLNGITLSTDKIIELLNQAPKLEALKFNSGKALGNATASLHLKSLKKLEIFHYSGFSDIIELILAGSLNHYCYFQGYQQTSKLEILQSILTKQYNTKSLCFIDYPDVVALRVNHLQLEKLELRVNVIDKCDQLVGLLKCHTKLKELRLSNVQTMLQPMQPYSSSLSTFEWICDNLNELEVLEMPLDSRFENIFLLLKKLTKLRHFESHAMYYLPEYGDQFKNDSLDTLKITSDRWWWYFEDFDKMVRSMVRSFTNLTNLEMPFTDFAQLSVVLSQLTTLIMLTSFIEDPQPHQLAEKCFPNMLHLTISTYTACDVKNGYEYDITKGMSIITSIVRAMPNLKSLWMPCTTIIFNVNEVKEFITASGSLDELNVSYFKLDQDLSDAAVDFVETVRRLSGQLKAYRLGFTSDGIAYSNAIKLMLSNEFVVSNKQADSPFFDLTKGVLSQFCDDL